VALPGTGRYALPALDGDGQPILVRDEHGRFPKREVSFAEYYAVTRPLPPELGFDEVPWQAYDPATSSFVPLPDNQPRIASFLGYPALQVDPQRRFNRVPAQHGGQLVNGTQANLAGDSLYIHSWIGNGPLNYTNNLGFSGTLPARPGSGPDELQWGEIMVPMVVGGEEGVLNYSTTGVVRGLSLYGLTGPIRDPSAPIETQLGITDYQHVERGPEHYRYSPEAIGYYARQQGGTSIRRLQLLAPPSAGSTKTIIGYDDSRVILGVEAPSEGYPNGALYSINRGGNTLRVAMPSASMMTSQITVGLSWRREPGHEWSANSTERKIALGGVGIASTEPLGQHPNNGLMDVTNFYLGTDLPLSGPSHEPGITAGVIALAADLWSPEYMTDAALQAAVGG
jgi:hypothetical protein